MIGMFFTGHIERSRNFSIASRYKIEFLHFVQNDNPQKVSRLTNCISCRIDIRTSYISHSLPYSIIAAKILFFCEKHKKN